MKFAGSGLGNVGGAAGAGAAGGCPGAACGVWAGACAGAGGTCCCAEVGAGGKVRASAAMPAKKQNGRVKRFLLLKRASSGSPAGNAIFRAGLRFHQGSGSSPSPAGKTLLRFFHYHPACWLMPIEPCRADKVPGVGFPGAPIDQTSTLTAMGNRRPVPKDFEVTFSTGAACCRLYSERSTRRTTCRTRSNEYP